MRTMNTLIIRLGDMGAVRDRIGTSKRRVEEGQNPEAAPVLNFHTYDDMHRVLAPPRLAIVKALAGQGILSIREVARRVGRDVQAVHRDVTTLINTGVIERAEKGVQFRYEKLHFDFSISAVALKIRDRLARTLEMAREAGPMTPIDHKQLMDEMWEEPSGNFSQTDIETVDLGKPRRSR